LYRFFFYPNFTDAGTIFYVCISPTNLNIMDDIPSGSRRLNQQAIEIKLWEIYLLRNRNNLNRQLSTYSIDNGPYHNSPTNPEQVIFRFMQYDWDKTVRSLLGDLKVPFELGCKFEIDVSSVPRKKTVYVAEDDLSILFALDTMLENAGYDVILSHCGSPMMENTLPTTDLFILDNLMPDINGIELCKHLKMQAETRHIPVIMISALRNFDGQARKAGADEFLEKPFQMHDLLKLVAKHTQNQLLRK
jgi:CheY-like chemotaxis protein